MRILEVNHGSGEVHRYALLHGEQYTIGRKGCRLPLPNGDPSISRHHATVIVGAKPLHTAADLNLEVDVRVLDCSKHGTLVNKELIGRDNSCYVYEEDRITFGKRISARVLSAPLVLAESSELQEAERLALRNTAVQLGALVVQEPVPSPETFFDVSHAIVAFLYVTRNGYAVGPPALLAMARQYHITTLEFVITLADALRKDGVWRPKELPQPIVAQPANADFPADEYMQPRTCFYELDELFMERSLLGTPLLQQYTFITPDVDVAHMYKPILHECGAALVSVSRDDTPLLHTYVPAAETVAVASDAVFAALAAALGKAPQTVMGGENNSGENGDSNSNSSGSDCNPQSLRVDDALLAAYTVLYRNGVSVVPERNIKRAIFTGNALEIHGNAPTAFLQNVDVPAVEMTATTTAVEAVKENGNGSRGETPSTDQTTHTAVQAESNGIRCTGPLSEMEANCCGAPSRSRSSSRLKSESLTRRVEASPSAVDGHACTKEDEAPRERQQKPKKVVSFAGPPASNDTDTIKTVSLRENACQAQECALLKKRPIVAHAPTQVTASKSGDVPVKRLRVTAHKLLKTTASPKRCAESPPPPAESVQRAHLEALRREPKYRQQQVVLLEDEEEMFDVSFLSKQCTSSQPSSRPCSTASLRFCDASNSSTPRSLSIREPLATPRRMSFGRTASQLQSQSHWGRMSSVRQTASSARRRSSPVGDPARLARCHTARPSSNDGASSSAAAAAARQASRLMPERTPISRTNSSKCISNHAFFGLEQQQQEGEGAPRGRESAGLLQEFLDTFAIKSEKSCQAVLRRGYVDAVSKGMLEDGVQRVQEFLRSIPRMERETLLTCSTEMTRGMREKALVTLRRIRRAYEAVGAHLPPSLQHVREAASSRPASARSLPFHRQHSMSEKKQSVPTK